MNDIQNFLQKPVPRYTSYPAIPYWSGEVTNNKWEDVLKNFDDQSSIDLYVHIPYCESLCWYCGCNREITKNKSKGEILVESIINEWKLYKRYINPKIQSIHLGGGTPTFLTPKDLRHLLEKLLDNEGSVFKAIELDPRVTNDEHIKIIKEFDFNKISLGIQDFNHDVQRLINRVQSYELVETLLEKINHKGLQEINFDLIYGLPGQSTDSIKFTLDLVKQLDPTSIAFYQYAHLPKKIANQRLIDNSKIPHPIEKETIHQIGRSYLKSNGYHEIGFDHFAKENSLLERCKKNNSLKRNFMGYTHQAANHLIGLGPTAISNINNVHAQNEKNIKSYIDKVSNGEFVITTGHKLSKKEIIAQNHIMQLMCQGTIELKDISLKQSEYLNKLSQYKLGYIENEIYIINSLARQHLRSIASIFDPHIEQE